MRGEVFPAFGFAQVELVAFLPDGGGELHVVQCTLGGGAVGRCHAGWVVIEDIELVTYAGLLEWVAGWWNPAGAGSLRYRGRAQGRGSEAKL